MRKIKDMYLLISCVIVLLVSGSCKKSGGTAVLYTPTTSDVTTTATLTDLQQGRTLYINNCNSCHSLYSPDDYSAAQWRSIVGNMAPRAGLTSAETALVIKYVTRGN
jgi:mono/diheme cytochrome c family protein